MNLITKSKLENIISGKKIASESNVKGFNPLIYSSPSAEYQIKFPKEIVKKSSHKISDFPNFALIQRNIVENNPTEVEIMIPISISFPI